MTTRQKYAGYLSSTTVSYTCSNLGEHLDGASRDVVSSFPKRERLTSRHLWRLAVGVIDDSRTPYPTIYDRARETLFTVNRNGSTSIQWR